MYEGYPTLPMCIIGMIQNENQFQAVVAEILACKKDPNENGKYIRQIITLHVLSLYSYLNHVFAKVSDLSFNDQESVTVPIARMDNCLENQFFWGVVLGGGFLIIKD